MVSKSMRNLFLYVLDKTTRRCFFPATLETTRISSSRSPWWLHIFSTEQLYLPVDYLCCKIGKQCTHCKVFLAAVFILIAANDTQNESVANFIFHPSSNMIICQRWAVEEQRRKENLTLEIIQWIHSIRDHRADIWLYVWIIEDIAINHISFLNR